MSDIEKQNQAKQEILSSEPVYPADTFPHKYVHSVFEDRQNVIDVYLNEAHRGNDILSVRITNTDQMAQVRDILAPYHAQRIQYIDTWTQADLSNTRHRGDW